VKNILNKYIAKIKSVLANDIAASVRYADIRLDISTTTSIVLAGNETEDAKTTENLCGSCRVLFKDGWGLVAFNNFDKLEQYLNLAKYQSSLIKKRKIKLADTPAIKEYYKMQPKDNPFNYSIKEKFDVCRNYNLLLKNNPQIQTTSVRYRDNKIISLFYNTEGSEIITEKIFCGISLAAIARDGNNIQSCHRSFGDYNGFKKNILSKESEIENIVSTARRLLTAEPVKPGKYLTIIDPVLSGVFAHEAFGHLSEADFQYENKNLKKIMKLGTIFGGENLNIIDDPTLPNLAGSYKYDSEGVKAQKKYLIKNGRLVGRLHSRETAAVMNEECTGNCRALNASFPPIVRMSNTYIENGETPFNKMLESIEYGIYAKGALGGMTNTEMFTFSAEEGYEIKNGKITKPLRDVILTGNVFVTLKNIDMIGNDLKIFGGLGGCGKAGQFPLPVSDGGPHLRIKDVIIGGK